MKVIEMWKIKTIEHVSRQIATAASVCLTTSHLGGKKLLR